MTKHTPGEWKAHEPWKKGDGWLVNGPVYEDHHERTFNKADAHLIAAAPDLLACCEELLSAYYDLCDKNPLVKPSELDSVITKKTYKAIAKAKGVEI